MSQIDLLPSFKGCALEAADFTLNHFVYKTPYEIWDERSLMMSYDKFGDIKVYVKQWAKR